MSHVKFLGLNYTKGKPSNELQKYNNGLDDIVKRNSNEIMKAIVLGNSNSEDKNQFGSIKIKKYKIPKIYK